MTADQIHRFVLEVAQRRIEWLEAQLAALKPGETLCVHEDRDDQLDLYRVTIHERAHVLGDEGCDERVRRTQYGPVPAVWREVVAPDELSVGCDCRPPKHVRGISRCSDRDVVYELDRDGDGRIVLLVVEDEMGAA